MFHYTYSFRTLAVFAAVFGFVDPLCGGTTDEDFESYKPGTFPSPTWLDAGLFHPIPPRPCDPSATVEVTTDADKAQTQAVAVCDFIGTAQGIYQIVGEACSFVVAADMRIDRWADPAGNVVDDWAMQIGIGRVTGEKQDIANVPQTGVYASSSEQGWRLYSLGTAGSFRDLTLNVPVTRGIWYRVQMALETATGTIDIQIWALPDNTLLFDDSIFQPDWTAEDGHYDTVLAIEGELSGLPAIANLAVIDNVSFQAVPCCPWDCEVGNADGNVGIIDFLTLLAQWGGPGSCDFDGGGVGINDFLELLANWGPCP